MYLYICQREAGAIMNIGEINPGNANYITACNLLHEFMCNPEAVVIVNHLFGGALCQPEWKPAMKKSKYFKLKNDPCSWGESRKAVRDRVLGNIGCLIINP